MTVTQLAPAPVVEPQAPHPLPSSSRPRSRRSAATATTGMARATATATATRSRSSQRFSGTTSTACPSGRAARPRRGRSGREARRATGRPVPAGASDPSNRGRPARAHPPRSHRVPCRGDRRCGCELLHVHRSLLRWFTPVPMINTRHGVVFRHRRCPTPRSIRRYPRWTTEHAVDAWRENLLQWRRRRSNVLPRNLSGPSTAASRRLWRTVTAQPPSLTEGERRCGAQTLRYQDRAGRCRIRCP